METTLLIKEFLSAEKEDTRRWLRLEMDTLLDSLFDKFNTKLVAFVSAREKSVPGSQSKDSSSDDNNNNTQPDTLREFTNSQPLNLLSQMVSDCNSTESTFPNCDIVIKEEEEIEYDITTAHANVYVQYHDENDEDCECGDCVNGGGRSVVFGTSFEGGAAKKVPEDEDECSDDEEYDDECAQWVEEGGTNRYMEEVEDEGQGGPAKRLRVGEGAESDRYFVVLNLKCLEDDCEEVFPNKEQLYDHLWMVHQVKKFRCLIHGCKESFDSSFKLGTHLKETHTQMSEWHCARCVKHYSAYNRLSDHITNYHHEGDFQCSYPGCGFISDCKGRLYNSHYKLLHSSAATASRKYVCRFPGCGHRFNDRANWIAHERLHEGIKPFRCRWPECDYDANNRGNIVRHIRLKHFNTPLTRKERRQSGVVEPGNINDWIEVVLNQ